MANEIIDNQWNDVHYRRQYKFSQLEVITHVKCIGQWNEDNMNSSTGDADLRIYDYSLQLQVSYICHNNQLSSSNFTPLHTKAHYGQIKWNL